MSSLLGLGGFDTPSLQGDPDEQRGQELQLGHDVDAKRVRLHDKCSLARASGRYA